MIQVALVDDHPAVRQGLAAIITADGDMEVIANFGRAEDLISQVNGNGAPGNGTCHPDVVVLDLRLPGMSGVDACAWLRSRHPEIRSILLTSYPSDEAIIAAFNADARGFLLKESTDPNTLSVAVRSVASGGTFIDPRVGGRVSSMLRTKVRTAGPFGLTVQEIKVLAALRQDLTNREIGEYLHLSVNTIKTHLSSVYRKLQVDNRSDAAELARREGIEWKAEG